MAHRIFLSHNYNDRPIVEPVAIRLSEIFGENQVFYDDWAIQPGDGIIDKMNSGLEAPEFVFFFVSANSLKSNMVKLEWQNALFAASQGKTRIIPVRVDGSPMPAILMQTLYIDMHTNGLEASIAQIVGVIQGNASFTPQHSGFSNLTFTVDTSSDGTVDIVIRASHLMEPNPNFMLLVGNPEEEINWFTPNAIAHTSKFHEDIKMSDGTTHNGITIRPMDATLTPAYPVRLQLKPAGDKRVVLRGVLHQVSETDWRTIPVKT